MEGGGAPMVPPRHGLGVIWGGSIPPSSAPGREVGYGCDVSGCSPGVAPNSTFLLADGVDRTSTI